MPLSVDFCGAGSPVATTVKDEAGCPGPNGQSGPRCIQFPAPCPQDTGRLPWSTDGSGQGECSGDWTLGVIADTVKIPVDLEPGAYALRLVFRPQHTMWRVSHVNAYND